MFLDLIIFILYICVFDSEYVCVPCVCLVPEEPRKDYQIPWN